MSDSFFTFVMPSARGISGNVSFLTVQVERLQDGRVGIDGTVVFVPTRKDQEPEYKGRPFDLDFPGRITIFGIDLQVDPKDFRFFETYTFTARHIFIA